MSKAGYIMKVEIFVPFDPNDPASVANAAKIVADENFGGMNAANCDIKVISSRMVMKRKAAETKTEPVEIERVEDPTPGNPPDQFVPGQMPDFLKRKAS